MGTRIIPSTRPSEAGPDRRVALWDERLRDFSSEFSAYPDHRTSGGHDTSSFPREAEVQAFRPTLSGGGRSQDVVIVLRIASPEGEASLMLSKAEASEVALALLGGVNDVGPLEVAAYLEAHPVTDDMAVGS